MEKEFFSKPYVVSREFNKCIEMLDIIHSASSICKIRGIRKVWL
jgi:hypothetical protein